MTARPRVLPVALPPVHGETIGSYLNRLADANHLPVGHLSSLIGPNGQHRRDDNRVGHWTPDALPRLAALTGRNVPALVRAMPPLDMVREPGQRLPPSLIEEVTEPIRRPACRLCMNGRGIHGLVVRSTPYHEGVCHRHHRWLLGDQQHVLRPLPEVVRANLKHRRLVRRYKDPRIALDYLDARDRTRRWIKDSSHPVLRQRWSDRLRALGEDPYGDPHRPSEARVELAVYPETVILTGLFASPHWRDHDHLRIEAAQRLGIDTQDLPQGFARGLPPFAAAARLSFQRIRHTPAHGTSASL